MQGYLIHHGIKGQRWGVRRYQNEDGTLTKAGEKRYIKEEAKILRKKGMILDYENTQDERVKNITSYRDSKGNKIGAETASKIMKKAGQQSLNKVLGATIVIGSVVAAKIIEKKLGDLSILDKGPNKLQSLVGMPFLLKTLANK